MRRPFALLLVLFIALAGPASAAVKPNPLISDGMVLQQGKALVWGAADPGEKVTVSFQGHDAETTAKDGAWTIWLSDLRAGGPFEMTIHGDNVLHLKDVYVGEVWLCAGQMNMDWPLHLAVNGADVMRDAKDAHLRFFQVRCADKPTPQPEAQGAWQACTPDTAANFSAVAYFFGRDLRRKLGVPVGVIQATTSTATADCWADRCTLERDPKTKEIVQKYDEAEKEYAGLVERYLDDYRGQVRKAVAAGKDAPISHPPENPFKEWDRPAGLYNGMIAPLQPYAIRGVCWYQGESDTPQPGRHEALLTAVIDSWRAAWKVGDFPFLIVQLAPAGRPQGGTSDGAWAEVREAQARVSRTLPRCALVVAADLGACDDVHPPDKASTGDRLALAAGVIAYGEKASYTGPVYESVKVENNTVVVQFSGAAGGLTPADGAVRGFTVAGDDRRFVKADAVVRGDAVVVSSQRVPHPVAVRYGWADYPTGDLADSAGLPAAPFRSDDFPLPAKPVKPTEAPTRPLTRGVPAGAVKVDVPGVQQHDDYSCGAAALMAVCSYFGVGPDDLDEYKKKLGTNEENGTNVYEILKMARQLGLAAEIHHGMTFDELRKHLDEGAPIIVSIQAYGDPQTYYRDDNGHYVVVIGYDESNFYFEDPVLPGRRGFLPIKEFDRRWHDDEGTTEKPDPHAHLGVVIQRKPGDSAKPPPARKID
ncbi:MAG TPA: C39 family peptidase [Gemmataceae bacterium]|nr:C39 family peptidase [Gemmataceae bacterium]